MPPTLGPWTEWLAAKLSPHLGVSADKHRSTLCLSPPLTHRNKFSLEAEALEQRFKLLLEMVKFHRSACSSSNYLFFFPVQLPVNESWKAAEKEMAKVLGFLTTLCEILGVFWTPGTSQCPSPDCYSHLQGIPLAGRSISVSLPLTCQAKKKKVKSYKKNLNVIFAYFTQMI